MKTHMTKAYTKYGSGQGRRIRWFGRDIEHKTDECIYALREKTNELALLRLAGGNKWIVRRAIEIYKRQLWYAAPGDWDNFDCELYGYL